MRALTVPRHAACYTASIVLLCIVCLVIVEMSVRSMSTAHCKLALGNIWGCVSYKPVKRSLSNRASGVYLGDSHMRLAEVDDFQNYFVPGSRPGDMLTILKFLSRNGFIEKAVISMAAHHMRDDNDVSPVQPVDRSSFNLQVLPFPVYFLEPHLTSGLKQYLWHTVTGRPLPDFNGEVLRTDSEIEARQKTVADRYRAWQQNASQESMRWWQSLPIRHSDKKWQTDTQEQRDTWTMKRFTSFFPAENYKQTDAHEAMLELFALLNERNIETCFVRMPHSDEWTELTQRKENVRYLDAQQYIEEQVRQSGFRYVDTATLKLDLDIRDFRNADHVYHIVLDQLTPVILKACFQD